MLLGVAVIWYTDTCTERTLALAGSARECGVTRILRRICTDFSIKKSVFTPFVRNIVSAG